MLGDQPAPREARHDLPDFDFAFTQPFIGVIRNNESVELDCTDDLCKQHPHDELPHANEPAAAAPCQANDPSAALWAVFT